MTSQELMDIVECESFAVLERVEQRSVPLLEILQEIAEQRGLTRIAVGRSAISANCFFFVFELIKTVITVIDTGRYCFLN